MMLSGRSTESQFFSKDRVSNSVKCLRKVQSDYCHWRIWLTEQGDML